MNKDYIVIQFIDGGEVWADAEVWNSIGECLNNNAKAISFESYTDSREVLVPISSIKQVYRAL